MSTDALPDFQIVNSETTGDSRQDSPGNSLGSDDLACEICGTPLVYAGRGRKPKRCDEHKRDRSGTDSTGSSGGTRGGAGRGSASVEQAVATLGNLYDAVGLGFLLTSPQAASVWTGNVPELQTRNRQILQGDPELVRSINRLGVKGGKFAFVAAQAWALTPAVMIAAADQKTKAQEKNNERAAKARRDKMRTDNAANGTPPETPGPGFGNRDFFG